MTPRAFDPDDVLFISGVANVLGAAIARHAIEESVRGREAGAPSDGRRADGLLAVDPATNTVAWSPELEALFGLAPGSFAGNFESLVRVVHPDDRTRTVELVTNGRIQHGDRLRPSSRAARRNRRVGAREVPLRAPDGSITQWLGVGIDVTAAKTAAAERERLLELEQALPR